MMISIYVKSIPIVGIVSFWNFLYLKYLIIDDFPTLEFPTNEILNKASILFDIFF